MTSTPPEVLMLPVDDLRPCEVNPRFSVGDVSELAASIEALGVLVPLLVTPRGKGYLVVAGHRRLAACKQLGMDEVPAIVRELGELERLEMMLVENQQRVSLSPVEEGIAYARILKQHPITQRKLAEHVGKSQGYVSKRLAILRLPKHVLEAIHSGNLTVNAALGYTPDRRVHHPSIRPSDIRPTPCTFERHNNCSPERCEVRHFIDTGEVRSLNRVPLHAVREAAAE